MISFASDHTMNPEIVPYLDGSSALPAEVAASYLGLCANTVAKYRRLGVLPGYQVSVPGVRRPRWRYLVADLERMRVRVQTRDTRLIDPAGELPVSFICVLTSLHPAGVWAARRSGALRNFTAKEVGRYLAYGRRRGANRWLRERLENQIKSLKQRLREAQALNRRTTCKVCHSRKLGLPEVWARNAAKARAAAEAKRKKEREIGNEQ